MLLGHGASTLAVTETQGQYKQLLLCHNALNVKLGGQSSGEM